jgi:hypothetical protein
MPLISLSFLDVYDSFEVFTKYNAELKEGSTEKVNKNYIIVENNGTESALKRVLDGSTYPS